IGRQPWLGARLVHTVRVGALEPAEPDDVARIVGVVVSTYEIRRVGSEYDPCENGAECEVSIRAGAVGALRYPCGGVARLIRIRPTEEDVAPSVLVVPVKVRRR